MSTISIPRPPAMAVQGRRGRLQAVTTVEHAAALALFFLYLTVLDGHMDSIDSLIMYYQSRSLLYAHTLQFHPAFVWDNLLYTSSKYGIGLSLLYLPGVAIWSWLLPYTPVQDPSNPTTYTLLFQDPLYTLACAPVNAAITAVAAYLVARLLRSLGFSRTTALYGLVLYGVGSPAFVYTHGGFSQPLEALCWIAAIYATVRYTSAARPGWLWLCALSCAYAVLTRPIEGAILLPSVLLTLIPTLRFWQWKASTWSSLVGAALSSGVGIGITLVVDKLRYGGFFTTGYNGETWTTPLDVGLPGVLISPGRGILWEFPAILLIGFGVWQLFRRRHGVLALALLGAALAQLLNVALWDVWWGGANWGLRLFVPALPLVAVLAACGSTLLPRPLRIAVSGLLLLLGLIWAVPGILTDQLRAHAGVTQGTAANGDINSLAPIGAWANLSHIFARSANDTNAIDILWMRNAVTTNYASLVPMAVLGLLTLIYAVRTCLLLSEPEAGSMPAAVSANDLRTEATFVTGPLPALPQTASSRTVSATGEEIVLVGGSQNSRLSVLIPVFNEQNTILEVVRRVQEQPFYKEIIIVDDGSTDGTRDVLKSLADVPNVHVVLHAHNQGKGAALRTGFQEAAGDIIIIQDADLEYNPSDFPVVLRPILDGVADVVYGSRFLGTHRSFMLHHFIGNKLLTLVTNLLYNNMLTDMETGYKAFRAPILRAITIRSNRFDFEPEITAKVLKQGYRIYEVPIYYAGRDFADGKKITWRDAFAALGALLRFRFSD